jgi:hypothetical protein
MVDTLVLLQRQADLLEVVHALGSVGSFPDFLDRG